MKRLKTAQINSLTRGTPLLKLTALELWTPFSRGFSILFLFATIAHPFPGEHFFAGVAQLVEQLIRNQQVSGSSPLAGSAENKILKPLLGRAFFLSKIARGNTGVTNGGSNKTRPNCQSSLALGGGGLKRSPVERPVRRIRRQLLHYQVIDRGAVFRVS